jgi:hypothetical protein
MINKEKINLQNRFQMINNRNNIFKNVSFSDDDKDDDQINAKSNSKVESLKLGI